MSCEKTLMTLIRADVTWDDENKRQLLKEANLPERMKTQRWIVFRRGTGAGSVCSLLPRRQPVTPGRLINSPDVHGSFFHLWKRETFRIKTEK